MLTVKIIYFLQTQTDLIHLNNTVILVIRPYYKGVHAILETALQTVPYS